MVSLIPKISVILPVYNGGEFIGESVKSILDQTFGDFEFIIINDCSTDNTADILNSFTDERIRVIHNETNLKVVKTLNKGLQLARGQYIARMDADDIAHPLRFEKQAVFLDTNQDIDICGTWVQTIGHESEVMKPAMEHEHIKVRLFFLNPMFHPAVMFRSHSFKTHQLRYDERYSNAEDYGLWAKAIDIIRFANIPEILLKYRVHDTNLSVLKESNETVLDEIHYHIYGRFLKKLKIEYTKHELLLHRRLGIVQTGHLDLDELKEYLLWLRKLTISNNRINYFEKEHFRNVILSYILYLAKQTSPALHAIKLAYKTLGDLYNLKDCNEFFLSRIDVKLHPIEKF